MASSSEPTVPPAAFDSKTNLTLSQLLHSAVRTRGTHAGYSGRSSRPMIRSHFEQNSSQPSSSFSSSGAASPASAARSAATSSSIVFIFFGSYRLSFFSCATSHSRACVSTTLSSSCARGDAPSQSLDGSMSRCLSMARIAAIASAAAVALARLRHVAMTSVSLIQRSLLSRSSSYSSLGISMPISPTTVSTSGSSDLPLSSAAAPAVVVIALCFLGGLAVHAQPSTTFLRTSASPCFSTSGWSGAAAARRTSSTTAPSWPQVS